MISPRSRQRGFFLNPYLFEESPAVDPYFSNVSLLIHGTTSIVDLSQSAKAITTVGAVSVSDGSMLFAGGYFECQVGVA